MRDNIIYKSHDGAVTLIELVLALALGALILASLTIVFKTGWQSWKENNEKSELIQHARVAMWRITDDLRYAQQLDELPASGYSGNLQFTTVNLFSDPAVIRYEVVESELRRIAEEISSKIAGSSSEGISVTAMDSTPFKLGVSGNLVALDAGAGDVASDAIAVKVDLTLQDADGNSFTLGSTAKLRNKTASTE